MAKKSKIKFSKRSPKGPKTAGWNFENMVTFDANAEKRKQQHIDVVNSAKEIAFMILTGEIKVSHLEIEYPSCLMYSIFSEKPFRVTGNKTITFTVL